MAHYGTMLGEYESSLFETMPLLKYYDLYSKTDFLGQGSIENSRLCTIETCGGHALYYELYSFYEVGDGVEYRLVGNYEYWMSRSGLKSYGGTEAKVFPGSGVWRSVLVPGFGD
jgi:hypothetical protein